MENVWIAKKGSINIAKNIAILQWKINLTKNIAILKTFYINYTIAIFSIKHLASDGITIN